MPAGLTLFQENGSQELSIWRRTGYLFVSILSQVYVYRPNREPEILGNPESVSCEPEMPMFALKMAKIW